MDNEKLIVNSLYHGILLSSTTVGYGYLLKKMFKMKIDSIDKFSIEEIFKLGGIISLSAYTIDMLIERGVLPKNIMK